MTEVESWTFQMPDVHRGKCGEWMGKTPHGNPTHRIHHWFDRATRQRPINIVDIWTRTKEESSEALGERFTRLADKWSRDTAHVSSVSDLKNDPSYQQIIDMGTEVLPYLLNDLDRNKRFWFPALASITGLRPFDPKDMGNYQLMTQAWLRWGRRRGLI